MNYQKLDILLDNIKRNDDEAFEELYSLYYKRVFYFALQISKNEQDAQDIAQDTFIQLKKSLVTLQDNKAFSVWLHRIILSKAGGLFRKNKTMSLPDDHVAFKLVKENRDYMLPELTMHFQSDKDMLNYFLKSLDEKYRVVLVLSYFSGFKIKEIAKILKVPEGTVKSRMNTGKEQLRQKILEYEKREGVSLDFKTADIAGVLTAFFVSEASKSILPAFSTPILKSAKLISRHIAIQLATISTVVTVGAAGVYGVYQSQQEKKGNTLNTQTGFITPTLDANFKTTTYNNKVYDNAEDAFYELTSWSHCDIEMKKYSKTEIEAIKPLYDAIKEQNGVYWEMLKRRNWNIYFDKYNM